MTTTNSTKHTSLHGKFMRRKGIVRRCKACLGVLGAFVLLFYNALPSHAWGLTIEDLMERQGISRTDRVADLRKQILDALNIEVILPWENYAPDVQKIIGESGIADIWNAYERLEDSYNIIEDTYKEVTKAEDSIVSNLKLDRLDSYVTKYTSSITDIKDLDFSDYVEEDSSTGANTINLYEMLSKEAEKTWSKSGQETMKNMNAALQPYASAKAALGANQVQYAYAKAYPQKAISDYAATAASEMMSSIIKDLAQAEILAEKIKTQGRSLNENMMNALASRTDSFATDGGAWKATASAYTTLNKMRLGKDVMTANLYKLFQLRFKMKTYLALLETYEYANYCHTALQIGATQQQYGS